MHQIQIKVAEARIILGVSKKKMAALLTEGVLPYRVDVLDKRIKWLWLADVQRLVNGQHRKAA